MAVLTWRNVDAPDFRGSNQMMAYANELLSKAGDTAIKGINDWQQSQTEIANNNGMRQAMLMQDAEQLQQAMREGRIPMGQMDAQGMQNLQSRVGTLLNNATDQQNLNEDRYGFGKLLNKDGQDALVAQEQENMAFRALTDADRVRMVDELHGKLPPEAMARLRASLGNAAGGVMGGGAADGSGLSLGSPTGTGGAAAGGNWLSSLPAETQNYVPSILAKAGGVEAITGTNEEKAAKLLPHLIQQESGGNNNAVSPKGARGLTQVMPKTGVNPGYGVTPLQNESPEEYTRFGKDYLIAMLNKYDGDVSKALAAYNAGPGTVDNVMGGASSSSPAQVRATELEMARRSEQNASNNLSNDYIAAMKNQDDSFSDVAARLEDVFPGGKRADIIGALRKIHLDSDKTVTPALAGEIMKRAQKPQNWFSGLLPNGLVNTVEGIRGAAPAFGDGMTLDPDILEEEIAKVRSGRISDDVLNVASISQFQQQFAQQQQKLAQAQQQLLAAQEVVKVQPQKAAGLVKLAQKVQEEDAKLQLLMQHQQGQKQLNSVRYAEDPAPIAERAAKVDTAISRSMGVAPEPTSTPVRPVPNRGSGTSLEEMARRYPGYMRNM